MVVVDVGHVIELYAEFTRSGSTYTPFPDPRSHRIRLADLADEAIRTRLTQLWNYERFGVPRLRGTTQFYARNTGLQNQAVLYVQSGESPARVLIDPNPWAKDGATALAEWEPSSDGRYLAY